MQVSDVKPTSRPFSFNHSNRRNSFPPISADPFNNGGPESPAQAFILDDQMDPTKDRIIKLGSPIRSQEKVTLVIFPEENGHQTIVSIVLSPCLFPSITSSKGTVGIIPKRVLFSAGICKQSNDSVDQSCCNIEERRPRYSRICVLEVVDAQAEIRTCRFVVGAKVLAPA
ncbi:hypothetical protein AnigIFM50267_004685 [Aspergillus niger]|nr:hypothetical protein AnigIFM50267_004685 [Aspergillus niger]GLA15271.1 hypothetical protein AnigIFM62618_001787 [Aspergillus niger]